MISNPKDTPMTITHKGHPVQYKGIPLVGKIWPRTTDTPTAWATIIDHNGVEREVPLTELIIKKDQDL